MAVMRTNLPNSARRSQLESAIHEAIGDREGEREWGIDLHSSGRPHCLSLAITGPIEAWYKTVYEKDRITIGRFKAIVKDEIDRRLA